MNQKKNHNYIQLVSWEKEPLACFGYELNNINKDIDRQSEVNARRAFDWHKRLFDAISNNPINCFVVCKFRRNIISYDAASEPIRIAMVFYVKSKNQDKLTEETKMLANELSVLFTSASNDPVSPYSFVPISSSEQMNALTAIADESQVFDYMRKPVHFNRPNEGIGYKSKKSNPAMIQFIPQFFIPDYFSFGNVAQSLTHMQMPIDLSVYLAPISLKSKELADFKKIEKKHQLANEHFTKHEKETYYKHLEILFDDNTSHFLFHVQLTIPAGELIGHSVHNNIAASFFGNILNIEIASGNYGKTLGWFLRKDKQSLISFLHPQEIVQQCFRLPVTSGDDINWFSNQTNIHNYCPPTLPTEGILMGVKKYLSQQREVRISEHDLSRHAYIMGQTGVGKTTLLKTMILDHINKGHGVGVVDPHGDLISSIYQKIPGERIKDVIFFDPTKNHDLGINILEYSENHPEQRTFIFNELIKILDELYDLRQTGGPMFEQYFKNALFLIMEISGNLHDFHRFFFDSDFRERILAGSSLSESVLFIKTALERKGEVSFDNISSYITSKVNRFVQDDFIAPLINVKKSTIDFRNMIDTSKILLVRLPKGRLGSDGVKFIGTLLFNRIIMAALTREDVISIKEHLTIYILMSFKILPAGILRPHFLNHANTA
jgi:hypothetical protein